MVAGSRARSFIGLFGDASGTTGAILVGVAALLVFIGVAMLSPLVRPSGGDSARVSGRAHQERHRDARPAERDASPRRTASTAPALMIGLALVSFIAIIGASVKDTFASAIDNQIQADFVLSPKNFQGFSPEAAAAVRKQIRDRPSCSSASARSRSTGCSESVTGASSNFQNGRQPEAPPRRRPRAAYADGGVIAYKDTEENGKKVKVGQTLKFTFPKGVKEVKVAGIFHDKKALPGNGDYVLSLANWTALQRAARPVRAASSSPDGVSTAQADGRSRRSPTSSVGSAPTTRPSSRTVSSRSSTRS